MPQHSVHLQLARGEPQRCHIPTTLHPDVVRAALQDEGPTIPPLVPRVQRRDLHPHTIQDEDESRTVLEERHTSSSETRAESVDERRDRSDVGVLDPITRRSSERPQERSDRRDEVRREDGRGETQLGHGERVPDEREGAPGQSERSHQSNSGGWGAQEREVGTVKHMTKVLVVDDEEGIRALLTNGLTRAGYQVEAVATAEEATARSTDADLVVLDLMLPGAGGMETARTWRESGNDVPVVFLTARDETADKVAGLSLGDDYVTKPFSLEELVARVQAVLRRRGGNPSTVITIGDLTIDLDGHQVRKDGRVVELSPTEYSLLVALAETPGKVLSKQDALLKVWNYDFNGASGIVDTYVSYLRRKVDPEHQLIHTVRGVGHVLRDDR